MHATSGIFFLTLCMGSGAALMALDRARPTLLWTLFFAASLLMAIQDPSPLVFVSILGFAVVLWAENRFPRHKITEPERLPRKLGYEFLRRAARLVIAYMFAAAGFALWQAPWGLNRAGCPLWLQSIVALVASDFLRYWIHRGQHAYPIWWKFHRVHHLSREMRVTTNGPVHLGEFLVVRGVLAAAISMLLGLSPKAILYGYSLPAILISAQWAHANIDIPRGKLRGWARVLNSPNAHGVHHSQDVVRGNFGEIFTLWDTLFGTFVCPVQNRHLLSRFGVRGEEAPESFWGEQLLRVRKVPAAMVIPQYAPEEEALRLLAG